MVSGITRSSHLLVLAATPCRASGMDTNRNTNLFPQEFESVCNSVFSPV